MPSLAALTRPELIFPSLSGSDSATVIKALADRLAPHLEVGDADGLYRRLMDREELGSTGIGDGVAIPHCKLEGLTRPVLAIGALAQGIDFAALDSQPVRVFFLLVSPEDNPAEHLRVLAAISRWLKAEDHVERVLAGSSPEVIFSLLREDA